MRGHLIRRLHMCAHLILFSSTYFVDGICRLFHVVLCMFIYSLLVVINIYTRIMSFGISVINLRSFSIYLSFYLHIYYLFIYLLIYLILCMYMDLFILLFIYIFMNLFILFINIHIYEFIYSLIH